MKNKIVFSTVAVIAVIAVAWSAFLFIDNRKLSNELEQLRLPESTTKKDIDDALKKLEFISNSSVLFRFSLMEINDDLDKIIQEKLGLFNNPNLLDKWNEIKKGPEQGKEELWNLEVRNFYLALISNIERSLGK